MFCKSFPFLALSCSFRRSVCSCKWDLGTSVATQEAGG